MSGGQASKADMTQVVDLSFENAGSPGLRVAQGANLAASPPAFDLGASAASQPAVPGQGEPQFDLAGGSFNSQSGQGSSFGDTNQNVPTIGYQNVFTEDVKLVKTKKPSALIQILAALMLVFGGLAAYAWYATGDALNIFAILGLEDESLETVVSGDGVKNGENVAKDQSSVAPSSALDPSADPEIKADNVVAQASPILPRDAIEAENLGVQPTTNAPSSAGLWKLVKNEMGGDLPPRGKSLSTDEESSFKAGLSHEFNYQIYKTVLDLAAAKAPGSEELLRQALDSKKFWIRMRALIALADMGDDITDDDVSQALGKTHSELRARFFKRFEKSPCSVGCFYVARAALKHLDSHGRAQVVRVISREASNVRDVFMVAATFDSSEIVRKTAEDWLATQDIDPMIRQSLLSTLGAPNFSSLSKPKLENGVVAVSASEKDFGDIESSVNVSRPDRSVHHAAAEAAAIRQDINANNSANMKANMPNVMEQFMNLPIHKNR